MKQIGSVTVGTWLKHAEMGMYSQCGIEKPQCSMVLVIGAVTRGTKLRFPTGVPPRGIFIDMSHINQYHLIFLLWHHNPMIIWFSNHPPKKVTTIGPYSVILHIHWKHIAITIGSVLHGKMVSIQISGWQMIWYDTGGSCMCKWYSLHVYTFAQIKFVYLYMYITVIYIYTNGLFIAIDHVLVICFCGVWGSKHHSIFPYLHGPWRELTKSMAHIRSVWPRVLFDSLDKSPLYSKCPWIPKDSIWSPWKVDQFPP